MHFVLLTNFNSLSDTARNDFETHMHAHLGGEHTAATAAARDAIIWLIVWLTPLHCPGATGRPGQTCPQMGL